VGSTDHPADAAGDHLAEVADAIANGLVVRTLPKSRWTHEGHLLACISLVRRHGAAEALRIMRAAIPPYNEVTGVANTTTGGYHDTITVYYVWAVDRLVAEGASTSAILRHPSVERESLLRWWDRSTLMSPAARAGWVPPTSSGSDEAPGALLAAEDSAR
jgi:hypothetical protein